MGAPEGPAKAPSCVLPPVTRPGAHTAAATTATRYKKCAKATRRVAVPASTMQGTLAAPYRARRTSERAERAHLCVGVREQQIGSLPASPEVTTAWTRAPESPTAELAGCRIPKAQNPRLRIPIPKLLLGRKFSAGLSAWSVCPRPTLCFELIESLNPTYNPTSRSSEPQRGRLGRVPGPTIALQFSITYSKKTPDTV